MRKRRNAPAPASRVIVRPAGPGPLMTTFLDGTSSALVSVTVVTDGWNVIVLPGHTSMSAWRKVPAPLSPPLVTTGSMAHVFTVWSAVPALPFDTSSPAYVAVSVRFEPATIKAIEH